MKRDELRSVIKCSAAGERESKKRNIAKTAKKYKNKRGLPSVGHDEREKEREARKRKKKTKPRREAEGEGGERALPDEGLLLFPRGPRRGREEGPGSMQIRSHRPFAAGTARIH